MLKPRSLQASFYRSYLYDKIVPVDHLLHKINQMVDFSFVRDLVKDKYIGDFGRPAKNPEFQSSIPAEKRSPRPITGGACRIR